MIVKFQGKVEYGDYSDGRDAPFGLLVGGEPVAERLQDAAFNGPVTVAIADERFTGDLTADGALPGYSEWTPAEPEELRVGDHNLKLVLNRYEGQHITMWVADEPVNVLE